MRNRSAVLALVALAAVAACSDFGPGDEIGVWEARMVNGHPVPGTVPVYAGTDTAEFTIAYDRYRLEDGGLCTYAWAMTAPQVAADSTSNCTYAVQFDSKTITITQGGGIVVVSGPISSNSFTLRFSNSGSPENVLEYRRQ